MKTMTTMEGHNFQFIITKNLTNFLMLIITKSVFRMIEDSVNCAWSLTLNANLDSRKLSEES